MAIRPTIKVIIPAWGVTWEEEIVEIKQVTLASTVDGFGNANIIDIDVFNDDAGLDQYLINDTSNPFANIACNVYFNDDYTFTGYFTKYEYNADHNLVSCTIENKAYDQTICWTPSIDQITSTSNKYDKLTAVTLTEETWPESFGTIESKKPAKIIHPIELEVANTYVSKYLDDIFELEVRGDFCKGLIEDETYSGRLMGTSSGSYDLLINEFTATNVTSDSATLTIDRDNLSVSWYSGGTLPLIYDEEGVPCLRISTCNYVFNGGQLPQDLSEESYSVPYLKGFKLHLYTTMLEMSGDLDDLAIDVGTNYAAIDAAGDGNGTVTVQEMINYGYSERDATRLDLDGNGLITLSDIYDAVARGQFEFLPIYVHTTAEVLRHRLVNEETGESYLYLDRLSWVGPTPTFSLISACKSFIDPPTIEEGAKVLINHPLDNVYVFDIKQSSQITKVAEERRFSETNVSPYYWYHANTPNTSYFWTGTHPQVSFMEIRRGYEPEENLVVDIDASSYTTDYDVLSYLAEQYLEVTSFEITGQATEGNVYYDSEEDVISVMSELAWQTRKGIRQEYPGFRLLSLINETAWVYEFTNANISAEHPLLLELGDPEDLKTKFITTTPDNTIVNKNNISLYGENKYEIDYKYYKDLSTTVIVLDWWLARLSVPKKIVRLTSFYEDTKDLKVFDVVKLSYSGAPSEYARVRGIELDFAQGLLNFELECIN